jgi:hypothetical protein
MKSKILLIICVTLFLSCNQLNENLTETFIVPQNDLHIKERKINEPPPPPPPISSFYYPSNFIIDSSGHIFYYQQEIPSGRSCGSGNELNLPPTFINLKPHEIVEVPNENITQFMKSNVEYLEISKRIFSIASQVDTINSSGLAKIFKVLKDTAYHIKWIFRKTTQEENIVLSFKKQRNNYDYNEITWDSTAILFQDKSDYTPKIDE